MRVLHVIGAMDRGGAETAVMNLYRAIDREHVQFDFLVHEQRECDYDAEIKELGGRFYRLPRFNGINVNRYRQLCRDLFRDHPDYKIVHGHIGSCAALYLSEAHKAGLRTIAHSHAQKFPLSIPQLGFRVVSYPTRYIANDFLACSYEAGRDRFGDRVVQGNAFHVIKNGIDLRRYTCTEEMHRQAKERLGLANVFLVGHVGRFEEIKNHRFLLDVFECLHEKRPDAHLMLVGRGPLEAEMKEVVSRKKIAEAVTFMGVRDDVPELLKAFDTFVFPSFSEGLSMASVEAQAAGVPCVLSTGVPKSAVVSDSVKQLSLDESVDAWVDSIMAVSASEHTRDEGVDNARVHGFDINETASWLEQHYEQLLA